MPLIINNRRFSIQQGLCLVEVLGNKLSAYVPYNQHLPLSHKANENLNILLMKAFDSLPTPTFNNTWIEDASKVCYAYQAEMIVIPDYKKTNFIFPGTVMVGQCIGALASNGTGFALAHIDSCDVEINSFLNLLSGKKDITLVGGKEAHENSKKNLYHILKSLLTSKDDITIVAQQVLSRNNANELTVFECMRDELIDHAIVFYRKYFDVDLDPSIYLRLNPDDFMKKHATFTNTKLIESATHLLEAKLLMTDEKYREFNIKKENNLNGGFSHDLFVTFLNELLTIEGYRALQQVDPYGPESISEFRNFVFNIHTGEMHKISRHLETPYSTLRKMYDYDLNKVSYFLAYDGEKYCQPPLSKTFLDSIIAIAPIVERGIEVPEVEKVSNTSDEFYKQVFAGLVLEQARETKRPSLIAAPVVSRNETTETHSNASSCILL